jgi:predicted nucleic acid-binding protein
VNLLDTDTLSLLFAAHQRVTDHYNRATDDVVTTIITRIEILERLLQDTGLLRGQLP